MNKVAYIAVVQNYVDKIKGKYVGTSKLTLFAHTIYTHLGTGVCVKMQKEPLLLICLCIMLCAFRMYINIYLEYNLVNYV